jgi:cell division protease FtsH
MNFALVNGLFVVYTFFLSQLQHTTGQMRKGKNSGSGGSKMSEQTDLVTFADVAGVDEAKEELEEIVVC